MDNERFIAEYNIRRFKAQLAREQDAEKCRVLSSLIAAQAAKLSDPEHSSGNPQPDLPRGN